MTQMSPRILIHGGIHKTGTTSLQIALSYSRDWYSGNGFVYPQTGKLGDAHHILARALKDPTQTGQAVLGDFLTEVEREQRLIVISSEEFCLFDPREVKATVDFLKSHFRHISVVFYLRPQALILRSQYSQQLREGYIQCSFDEFFVEAAKHATFWNFRDLYELWTGAGAGLHENEVILRSALRGDLYESDLVQDFFRNFLAYVNGDAVPSSQDENISLRVGQAYVIRKILMESGVMSLPFEERRVLIETFILNFPWDPVLLQEPLPISRDILEYCRVRFKKDNAFLSSFFGNINSFDNWYRREISDVVTNKKRTEDCHAALEESTERALTHWKSFFQI